MITFSVFNVFYLLNENNVRLIGRNVSLIVFYIYTYPSNFYVIREGTQSTQDGCQLIS